jgi:hypothetical protein
MMRLKRALKRFFRMDLIPGKDFPVLVINDMEGNEMDFPPGYKEVISESFFTASLVTGALCNNCGKFTKPNADKRCSICGSDY